MVRQKALFGCGYPLCIHCYFVWLTGLTAVELDSKRRDIHHSGSLDLQMVRQYLAAYSSLLVNPLPSYAFCLHSCRMVHHQRLS